MSAGHVARDANSVADRLDREFRVVVDHERPADDRDACRASVKDVETAVGERPVIVRPHQEIPTALSAVRAGKTEVGHPPEPHVVDRAENPRRWIDRRDIEHHRSIGEVEKAPVVDRVAVPGQEHRRRVHQLREQREGVVLGPHREKPAAYRRERCARQRAQERLDAVNEVKMVVQQSRRRLRRRTIVELQRPKPSLDLVRRRDRPHSLSRDLCHVCTPSYSCLLPLSSNFGRMSSHRVRDFDLTRRRLAIDGRPTTSCRCPLCAQHRSAWLVRVLGETSRRPNGAWRRSSAVRPGVEAAVPRRYPRVKRTVQEVAPCTSNSSASSSTSTTPSLTSSSKGWAWSGSAGSPGFDADGISRDVCDAGVVGAVEDGSNTDRRAERQEEV